MSSRVEHGNENPHIGPSSEEQRHRQEEALGRAGEDLVDRLERSQSQQKEFNSRYGQDLGDYALAYGENRGNNKVANLRGNLVQVAEVRQLFVEELVSALNDLSRTEHVKWLNKFFSDWDALVQIRR